ncbi:MULTISPECIES: ATP-binding protein [unclassified Actinotalea]|uniref:ATP-binding protein n=1 Tax=unclassified Actinotalea TaxID=2638618 RepID=UPI0015F53C33|nr:MULTISPECIES: ATP-binding protein [unclassified Actinotalea]
MELRLPAHPGHIRHGRQWVRRQAVACGVHDHILRVLELLTSEVVTNAVKYGGGREVRVRVAVEDDVVRVGVRDTNPEPPALLDPGEVELGGRGMHLVRSLAQAWGVVEHAEDGKSVWFALALAPEGAEAGTRAG